MKKFVPLLVCIFLLKNTIIAQTYTSNCAFTSSLERIFRTDAIRLSIARMNETNNPYKDSIEIPQDVYDSALRPLIIINNMQSSILKDTINNLFLFQNFNGYWIGPMNLEYDSTHFNNVFASLPSSISSDEPFKNFAIEADTSIGWIKNWKSGNYKNTSNNSINDLVDKYNLKVKYLGINATKYQFKVAITGIYNIKALKQSFSFVEPTINNNFYYDSSAFYLLDGNTLLASYKSTGTELHYRNGCGDCPLGCTYGTQWHFFVPYDSCKVEYIGRNTWNSTMINPPICLRGSIVPIEFGNVSATKQGEQNQINFTALTEVNIKTYEIERSNNEKDFFKVNSIVSKNKNNSNYIVTDKNPLSGNNYYRIKAIENNGVIKYSKTVLVKNEEIKFNVYPNPTKGFVIVECKGAKQLSIIDYLGRTIKQLNNITEHQTINTQQLQKGIYLVEVINNSGEIKTRKIVVE